MVVSCFETDALSYSRIMLVSSCQLPNWKEDASTLNHWDSNPQSYELDRYVIWQTFSNKGPSLSSL